MAELRTGTITLLVQDGRVVQLDRHEKFRLTGMYNWHGDGI
ncbi:YezD family protein [Trichlorobacter lovleyi]|nr:YezD family protein [Trichlorobacter lovleyi]